jgi:hypothetical protein
MRIYGGFETTRLLAVGILGSLLGGCGDECSQVLGEDGAATSFCFTSAGFSGVCAATGGWTRAGSMIVATAEGFDSVATSTVSITYPERGVDLVTPGGVELVKVLPGDLRFTDSRNREFMNTEVIHIERSDGDADIKIGEADNVAMFSASAGSTILNFRWSLCAQ